MAATRTVLLKTGIITDLGTVSLIVTTAGVIGALCWYWAVRGTPFRFLFERPAWAQAASPRGCPPCSRRNDSQTRRPALISSPATAHIRAMPAPAKPKSAAQIRIRPSPPAAASPRRANPPNPPHRRPLKKGDHVFLVDGSGYIFRAYHALPPLTRKSDGLQVNAVLGFCNMLWKLLSEMKPEDRPTHLAVVFDKSEKTFRTDFYPQYKAHRPDSPGRPHPAVPADPRGGAARSTFPAWSRPASRPTT